MNDVGSASTASTGVEVERDMSRQQCLMVDQCFEEGQYESGIDALDQLRTNQVRPSPSHIRQLIYIALCRAPASSQAAQGKGKGKAPGETPFGSPTKAQRKETKTSFRPSAKASEAARRLLSSYAMTNLPEGLIRAIPCYKLTELESTNLPRSIDLSVKGGKTEEDSVIAQKSVELLHCGNCWNLLKPGLVSSGSASSWSLQASGKVEEDAYLEEDSEESQSVVGDTAWPLLTWLITLFEKDESLVKDESQGRYSALLFSQIKSSDGSMTRSNAEAPLQVVVACYEQSDSRRHYLGQRLMRLLINLTSCTMFSALDLLASLSNHLTMLSTTATLSKFLSDLPTTSRGTAFKAAVCDKTLGHRLGVVQQAQARKVRTAQPKATDGTPGSPSKAAARSALQKSYTFPVPSSAKIMEILSSFQKSTKTSKDDFVVLFHLVVAAGDLASEQEAQSDGDRVWAPLLLDGRLEKAIVEVFADKGRELVKKDVKMEIDKMGTILKMKCDVWKASCTR